LTDSCASVKSQLEAFGDTDVVVGQEKPELQSIIASCDELLTKTEANIFRWGVQTLLGDSRIGAVDLGAVLRKSLRSIVEAFPDPYSELEEEEVLVEISSFRTSVVILNKCAPHIESLICTEATLRV